MTNKSKSTKPARSNVRKTGSGKRTGVQQTLKQYEDERLDKRIFNWLWHSTPGRLLLVLTGFFLLVGLNLLIAQGNFERFALAMGIEVILAGLVSWLISAIRHN